MDLVLIGGVSGSGKSVALGRAGGFRLLRSLQSGAAAAAAHRWPPEPARASTAWRSSLDVKTGPDLSGLAEALAALQAAGWTVRFLYLDAKIETLVKRFSETRRRHPFSSDDRTLTEAIDFERAWWPMRAYAGHRDRHQ